MANIRPNQLPPATTITNNDRLILDQGAAGVNAAPPKSLLDTFAPVATQSEAEAGTDNVKRMTPLRAQQHLLAQGVPNTRAVIAGDGLAGGGTLDANLELALSSTSLASLALADSAVQSVNGKSGSSVTLTKADVGLGNVDNTSDADKPISTATQTALNAKADSSITITAGSGLTGGGNLTANRTIALNSDSIASLGKADTALQAPGGVSGQVLAKNSAADNDVAWVTSEAATAVSYGPQTLTPAQQVQARQNIQADHAYDTIADITSATVPAYANAIRTNGYYAAGDGGAALYKRVASEPTHAGKVMSADGAWWELAENEIVPQMFGGSPTLSSSDTAILQAWLDHPNLNKKHKQGEFLVTGKLVSTLDNARIECSGGTLVAGIDDFSLLEIRGDYTVVIPNIDGRGKGAVGVDIVDNARGCEVIDGNIRNLHSKTIAAAAVRATTRYGVTVSRNTFRNIKADGNGTIGDAPGASRAVLLTNTQSAQALSFIQDNDIYDIDGEEGDAIQVLFFDGTYPFLPSLCIISGNGIHNAYRRSIKIQGSDATIYGNKIFNTLNEIEAPHLGPQIDIITSERVEVDGNTVRCTVATCIQLAGANGLADTYYSTVTGNKLITGAAKPAIFLNYINACDCSGNTIAGGSNAIGSGINFNTTICDNKIHSNGTTGAGIIAQSNGGNLVISGNKLLTGARTPLIELRAPGCIVTDNFANNAVCVNISSTASGSYLDNNSNRGSMTTVTGAVTSVFNGSARNVGIGGGGVGGRSVLYATASPETDFTGIRFDRGDIVFNKSATASGIIGWVCTEAGTPGVWKSFGNISA